MNYSLMNINLINYIGENCHKFKDCYYFKKIPDEYKAFF